MFPLILFKNFVVKGLIARVLSFVISAFLPVKISTNYIHILNNKIITKNISIYDKNWNRLLYSEEINLDLDFNNKIILPKLEFVNSNFVLKIDKTEYVNIIKPFIEKPEYSEEVVNTFPLIGEIIFKNSKCKFVNLTYEKEITRDEVLEGKVVFNLAKRSVNVNVKSLTQDTQLTIFRNDEKIKVHIVANDIEIIPEEVQYTQAGKYIEFVKGKIDIDMVIETDFETKKDNTVAEGIVKTKSLFIKSPYFKEGQFETAGEIVIDRQFVNGSLQILAKDNLINSLFTINLYTKFLKLEANGESIEVSYFLNNLIPLTSFNFNCEGRAKATLFNEVDLKNKITHFRIELGQGCSFFEDQFIKTFLDLKIDEEGKIIFLDLDAKHIHGEIKANIQRENFYKIKGVGNANSKYLKFINFDYFPYFRADIELEMDLKEKDFDFKGKCNLLDSSFGEEEFKFKGKQFKDNFNIKIKNNKAKASFNNNSFNYSMELHTTEGFFKINGLEAKISGKARVDGNVKPLINLKKGDVDLNFDFIKYNNVITQNFEAKFDIEDNAFDIKKSKIKINVGEGKLILDNFDLRARKDTNTTSIAFYINSKASLAFTTEKYEFDYLTFNFLINQSGLQIRKISTNKFRIEGFIPYRGNSQCYLLAEDFKINDYLKIKKLDFLLQDNEFYIKDSNIEILNREFPLNAEGYYTDKWKLLLQIEKNQIKGTIGEELDLTCDFNLNLANNFILSGEALILGKINDPYVISDLFIKGLINASFSATLKQREISLTKLVINHEKSQFLNLDGNINLDNNKLKIIIKDRISLENIPSLEKGFLDLFVKIDGNIFNPKYVIQASLFEVYSYIFSIYNINFNVEGDRDKALLTLKLNSKNSSLEAEGFISLDFKNYLLKFKSLDLNLADFFNTTKYLDLSTGKANMDFSISPQNAKGFLNIQGANLKINLNNYYNELNSLIEFVNTNINLDFKGDRAKLNMISLANNGEVEAEGYYNLDRYDYELKLKTTNNLVSLVGYLNVLASSELIFKQNSIRGNITIHSGHIFDIPSFEEQASENDIKINLKLAIEELNVRLATFLNFEKISLNATGNLDFITKDSLTINGYISSESGSIEFNKYTFYTNNIRLDFKENNLYPNIYLIATTDILDKTISLNLRGNLKSKEIKILDKDEFNEEVIAISFWSNQSNDNIAEILYLLGVDNQDFLFSGGNLLSEQLAKSLFVNPVSRRLKNLFGFYQFKVVNPFLELSSIIEGKYKNIFSNMRIELSTNIYKNIFFFEIDALFNSDGNSLDKIDFNFFSINKWNLYFSFESQFDNILFKGLGISKKLNFIKNSFELGISNFENVFYNFSEINFMLSVNLRF